MNTFRKFKNKYEMHLIEINDAVVPTYRELELEVGEELNSASTLCAHSMESVYNSMLENIVRTNNASKGWHNRFHLLVGRRHPSLYRFFTDLQKEQADVEYNLRDFSSGRKINSLPKTALQQRDNQIFNIVHTYQDYVQENNELEYLHQSHRIFLTYIRCFKFLFISNKFGSSALDFILFGIFFFETFVL